ncbi:DUF504 domain-containing protein [Sulfuriflexus mobilis]|uniref:DUF504 domain-containing protein n=1 Tax=Sulfuriflexus mobilis TaxID=1811807 RepID=UPI000F834735|nr:DUF504 domain-containing protein [Sulfuriflexus mobilis]
MQTINELLNRIHWDPEFGEGEFEVAFLDRVEQEMIRLPFRKISFVPGEHFFFYYFDDDAVEHSVPFHRIKAVYKNDECIWHRER